MEAFNKATDIVYPIAVMENGSTRFVEMALFIYVMTDETFMKWMTIQEIA